MKVVITGSSGFYGTHLIDVLFNNIEDIEIVGIDTDQRLNDFPVDSSVLEKCVPIYEDIEGWDSSTAGINEFDDLPNKDILKIPPARHISEYQ